MGKTVPMASFRRAARPTDSAVAACVELGDAPGDTPPPVASIETISLEVETAERTTILHVAPVHTEPEPTKTEVAPKTPAKWRRKTLRRADGRELRKQTIYLDAELSHRLMVTCAENQYDLSEAIEEAVNFWLKKRA